MVKAPPWTALFVAGLLSSSAWVPASMGVGSTASSSPSGSNFVATFPLARPGAIPLGITTDRSGDVWFAEDNSDAIVEFMPANSTFHSYAIPTAHHLAWIWFLIFDAGGNLWFSDESQPLLWVFSTSTHAFANFSANGAHPFSLWYDVARGRMWFTSLRTEQVGYFEISQGRATLGKVNNLTAPTPGAGPSGVVTDANGDAFVSETFQARIVEFNGNSLSIIKSWQLPKGSEPVGLSLDPSHGRLWFTNHASSYFGYVDLGGQGYAEFPTSLFSTNGTYWVTLPYWISESGSGAIWFDEHSADRMARFMPGNMQLTEFPIPTSSSAPLRFAIDDSTGKVWFTEFAGNAIGVVLENSSLSQSVQVAVTSATVSPSATLQATPSQTPAAPPTVSLTGTVTGVPEPAFHVSLSQSGSAYAVSLALGDASAGNYTSAVCFGFAGTDQCGYALLVVPPAAPPTLLLVSLYLALGAIAAGLILAVRRERLRKRGASLPTSTGAF